MRCTKLRSGRNTMELFSSIPFVFENNTFDIRILYDDTTINVLAFQNSHPANGYRYQIKVPKVCDPKNILEKYPVPELVEKCKNDIKEKTWDLVFDTIKK